MNHSRLADVPLDARPRRLPRRIGALLDDADDRIERFVFDNRDDPIPAFVPSDFVSVYAALACVAERGLAAGGRFVEWGSGMGVVTCLAALTDLDAVGIEIEQLLVDESIALADDHEVAAEFVCGTFLPEGGDRLLERHAADLGRSITWLRADGADAYEQIGLEIEDFDVVFAYPWPGEEGVVYDLFARHASVGSLLLTHHGEEELRLRRKVR